MITTSTTILNTIKRKKQTFLIQEHYNMNIINKQCVKCCTCIVYFLSTYLV